MFVSVLQIFVTVFFSFRFFSAVLHSNIVTVFFCFCNTFVTVFRFCSVLQNLLQFFFRFCNTFVTVFVSVRYYKNCYSFFVSVIHLL